MFFNHVQMQYHCEKVAERMSVEPDILMNLAEHLAEHGLTDSQIKQRLDKIAKLWEK